MTRANQQAGSPVDDYFDAVGRRLADRGYAWLDDGPANYRTTVYHRRKLSLTKFGLVDYFVVLAHFQSVDPASAEAFSQAAFRFGLDNKSVFPRGLGGNLVVYPVVVGRNLPRAVTDWVRGYQNKHWAAFEFPSVADVGTGELAYNASKPMWGRAYYGGFHSFADECLTPPAPRGPGGGRPR